MVAAIRLNKNKFTIVIFTIAVVIIVGIGWVGNGLVIESDSRFLLYIIVLPNIAIILLSMPHWIFILLLCMLCILILLLCILILLLCVLCVLLVMSIVW